jgi:bifunctional oligoribonuclease and PAP phosphatase NrnA
MMQEKFLEAKRLIDKAEKVLVIAHKKPDGDTLGAVCGMHLALKAMGKKVQMACVDDVSDRFLFLPEVNRFIKEFDFRDFDLLVVMDAGASYMTRYHEIYPDIFKGAVPVINMDHHASNDNFGTCNIVDAASASATVVLFKFFEFCGIPITSQIATSLLCGIYNDTGSLMHSNTNLEVFQIAERLVELGARVNLVAKNLFRNTTVSTLKIWGRALENVRINEEGVTVSVVTWRDFEECGANGDEISGVVDLLNSVPGAKYVCLLNEDRNGKIKGSFRTQRDDVDLSELASRFGGGGHKKAAGFMMPGRLHREVHWKIVPDKKLPAGTALPETSEVKL